MDIVGFWNADDSELFKSNFHRFDFQIPIDLTCSLSLPKGIKKAISPFYAALFAHEEAAWRELR